MTSEYGNGLPQRAPDGRFMPGNSCAKGRARDRLSRAFLEDMLADWERHGRDAIARVREEKPERYLQIVAQFVPKEVKVETNELDEMSDEELRLALAAALNELAETGGELIASLPPRTREVLDLQPAARRLS